MKITWIGHSCFKIEKNGFTLIIDPYSDGSVPGLLPIREKANMVLCSHEHGDHNGRDTVVLEESAENPFTIEVLNTYHDDVSGAKRGINKIFIINDGENKIAHMGDLGCELEYSQKERLKSLDAVMIPVGGFFTIDGLQAVKIIKELNPKMVIPMHFRNDLYNFGYDVIGTVESFTENMDSVVEVSGSEIETSDKHNAQTIVLHPLNVQK